MHGVTEDKRFILPQRVGHEGVKIGHVLRERTWRKQKLNGQGKQLQTNGEHGIFAEYLNFLRLNDKTFLWYFLEK